MFFIRKIIPVGLLAATLDWMRDLVVDTLGSVAIWFVGCKRMATDSTKQPLKALLNTLQMR
ncbi:MAG: hypothetical protein K0R48_952 [Gammaproteobacteria bacterium]|jgi:hypothetical protein|nr:hypothetical protein [Gammaproteobacteria bacterium]